jgi:hypothetical protein
MKIFGNCLVKNEADIVAETLTKAARWCDRIFVFDNGSTDGTWEIVQSCAQREPRIVAFRTAAVPFRNSLRRDTYQAFRHEARSGDWWCKLDADEIYLDDPRTFLAAVPHREHVVWAASFQFYFTDEEVQRFEQDPRAFPPQVEAERALRHFRCDYSEPRFFRHRDRLRWDSGSEPRHLGIVHPHRIRLKHYQYRSPSQITLRLATRQQAIAQGAGVFQGYCEAARWQDKVVSHASCRCVDDPDAFLIDEAALPRHLEPPWRRVLKYAMHGSGLWP